MDPDLKYKIFTLDISNMSGLLTRDTDIGSMDPYLMVKIG